jgi:DNA-binding HxlR family transcriptional regulator
VCPVQFAINLIHGKWKSGILSELQQGPSRLSQLLKKFPAASKKMLTQHLRELVRDGLVVRTDLSGKLRHVEYSISDPRGVATLQMIQLLAAWGMTFRLSGAHSEFQTDKSSEAISIATAKKLTYFVVAPPK